MKNQVILAICLVLLIGTVFAVDVTKVGDWWGTVIVNGEYANGDVVDAYIDNIKVASVSVGILVDNYYLIHVEGNEGDIIVFKVNGVEAETVSWSNGDHELDLSVTIDTSYDDDDDTSTSSSGGGGDGGGSSSSSSSSTTSTSSSTQDSTTNASDNQDDILSISSLNEEQTSGTGLGAVIGGVTNFAKSGTGTIILFILVVTGLFVLTTLLRKRIEKVHKGTENFETESE